MGKPGADFVKICKKCGKEFHPNSTRQQCCNSKIQIPCVICGKLMDRICTFTAQTQTCSKECNNELIRRRQIESANKLVKKCKYCGKEFHPTFASEEYCEGPHYRSCEICGKQFEIDPSSNYPKTCSNECRYIAASQNKDIEAMKKHYQATLQERYGVDNIMELQSARDKIKKTMEERYGGAYTATEEYKNRIRETSIKKYGVDHYLKSDEVKSKRINTIQNRYGVDNVFQLDGVKSKSKETIKRLYGVEYISQNQDIIDAIKQRNIQKYGVEHPMMLPEYKEKAIQTNFKKYGVASRSQIHIKNIQNWYRFIDNPRVYISENYSSPPRTEELALDLGVDRSTVDEYLSDKHATDCVRRARSLMEEEIITFIRKLKPDCKIISNNKTILERSEMDIYLPEYQFAIECNPTVTHNSSFPDPWSDEIKPISYHKRKSDKAENKGIFLMHIFGYEWTHKKDILKSMISNILGTNTRIYARKCRLVNVPYADAKVFLQNNHRQGFSSSSVYIGLEYNGELISLMSFNKMRSTIGIDSSDLSNCWELARFCSKLNTSVVGGASKLFKYFVDNHNPKEIRSFSDRAHTRGKLYQTLGFTELRRNDESYVWVNIVDNTAYHRINTQKRNLKKFLKDDNIDLTQSEKEIMESHGYARVFDSGTITWQWLNS